jgi:hypothetical protein
MTTTVATEVRALADRLAEAAPDEVVTYEHLATAVGHDLMRTRYLIYKALKLVQKETGAAFITVYKQGYRRMRIEEVPSVGKHARRRTRRIARTAIAAIQDSLRGSNDVAQEVRREALREQSALGLIEHIARDKHLPVIEENASVALPHAVVALQFLTAIGGIKTPG